MHVVVDWDGTVTERDTLQMVLERFGDLDLYARAETALGRSMTLNQVIAAEMATVRAPLEEVVDWLRAQVVVRRGFRDLVDRHRPLVLSAGFHELIEPILEREGIAVEVVANRLVADAGGWRTVFRSAVPCAVCGEPCKRDAVSGLDRFAYVGDGISDRCVSLRADRVFARAGLATYLDARGVAFEPFADFHEVVAGL